MKRLSAIKIYLLMQGGQGLFFATITTVNMVYQVVEVGLNPLQLVLVGTVLEASAFLFEIPTGLVAGYGRAILSNGASAGPSACHDRMKLAFCERKDDAR